jgi:hypothetical protein
MPAPKVAATGVLHAHIACAAWVRAARPVLHVHVHAACTSCLRADGHAYTSHPEAATHPAAEIHAAEHLCRSHATQQKSLLPLLQSPRVRTSLRNCL